MSAVWKGSRKAVFSLAAILLWSMVACKGSPAGQTDELTGIEITVQHDVGWDLNQLLVSGFLDDGTPAFDPGAVPDPPRPLTSGEERTSLLLSDNLGGEIVTLRIDGMSGDDIVASATTTVSLLSDAMVAVTLFLDGSAVCGDGIVGGSEVCDDGFTDACGSCNAACTAPGAGSSCGDGLLCPETELCDDGYADACGSCSADCSGLGTGALCGDGEVCAETERCDDGFTDACGSCNATCTAPGIGSSCGDGFVCPEAEACDDGFADVCGSCDTVCSGLGTGSLCGDGEVCPETEKCDDSFTDACGSCNAACTAPGIGSNCGDGLLCPETELCDDGYADACGSCNADCSGLGSGALCGDGEVCAETEKCDDGFTDICGTCNSTCAIAGVGSSCGDGVICAETEQCDDNNSANGDGCDASCRLEIETCGNGTIDPPETCDDGFEDACGSCNANCTAPGTGTSCGDGVVCPETEVCDDDFADACGSCNTDCTAAGTGSICGDGAACPETEFCDDGYTDACGGCNALCSAAGTGSTCGDSEVCLETERCDVGDVLPGDGCDADCQIEPGSCGDGIQDGGEACDDGFADPCGTCNADCTGPGAASVCGDGVLCLETESCDDGFTDGCGGCDATCSGLGGGSICGDGVVCPETETCDDGFNDSCGSCDATCDTAGSSSTCGDGVMCPETEACDDGFNDSCGSCDATCETAGSSSTCGDGVVCPEFEVCDDGFNDSCGSCDATCAGPGAGSVCGDGLVCPEFEVCDDGQSCSGSASGQIVINEVVTDAVQDWEDSKEGGAAFDATPGTAKADDKDEWVELYNSGCEAVALTNHLIHFVDADANSFEFGGKNNDGQHLSFSDGGSVSNFQAGEYLTLGTPAGDGKGERLDDDIWIHVDDPLGTVLDDVALGTSLGGDGSATNNAPSGSSGHQNVESISRYPNGSDTDDDSVDWQKTIATIASANNPPCAFDLAFDATTSSQGETNTLIWSHTTAGEQRALLVGVAIGNWELVSSVTYAGVPLSLILQESNNSTRAETWLLVAPTSGSNDIEVTLSDVARVAAGAVSLNGVAESAPVANIKTAGGTGTTASAAFGNTYEGWVIDTVAFESTGVDGPGVTRGAAQTEQWTEYVECPLCNIRGGSSTSTAVGAATMSWDFDAAVDWAIVSVSVAPACQ